MEGLKLLVVSHVIHYLHEGSLHAYGPYAREIDVWADLFHEVRIAAPVRQEAPPGDCLAFERPNIVAVPQLETGGDTFREKAAQMLSLPVHCWRLARAMADVDAIHVRCPGNLGLLGAVLAPLFSEKIVAKYAGQWHAGGFIAATYRLQRWILCSRWWRRGIVTVYGQWPGQPAQVVPFFTSMMTGEQVARSQRMAAAKRLQCPAQILYSGRLVPGKGLDVLLEAVQMAWQRGIDTRLAIVGDGPERPRLERLAITLGIEQRVHFEGAVPFGAMMNWYEKSHILVLASQSEGWPKAITEAMCHGVVCVGSTEGLLPWMLQDRGLTVRAGNAAQLAEALSALIADPLLYLKLSRNAAQWAQGYSLEGLREALRSLLAERWNLSPAELTPPASSPAMQPVR